MLLNFGILWLLTALLWPGSISIGNRQMLAEAWVARGNYHNDAYPGKCVITETLIISPGESVKLPTSCAQITCSNTNGDARIVGCGAVGAPNGCRWGEHVDKNAPFRECCARHLICDGGLNNETQRIQESIWKMFMPELDNVGDQDAVERKEQNIL